MNVSTPIWQLITGDAGITAALPDYQNGKPVFKHRPIPEDAVFPVVVISPDIAVRDEDGLNDDRPVIVRDVTVYGQNDTQTKYQVVESIGYALRDLFHRTKTLNVPGWALVDMRASGPVPAPVDDQQLVARRVELSIRLARKR